MSAGASDGGEHERGAELVATLCLATDLGMGLPLEHGLRSTVIAVRLGDRLGVDRSTARHIYYASLLSHAGCTSDAHVTAEIFGDSLTAHFGPVMYGPSREMLSGLLHALPESGRAAPVRALQIARGLPRLARELRPQVGAACEVAGMLARGLGLPPAMTGLLAHLTERWDGRGPLRRARGEQIPLAMRIVHVASDAAFQEMLGGADRAIRLVHERAGGAFDPEVADCLVHQAGQIFPPPQQELWEETLAREPDPPLLLAAEGLDRALAAMGNFADLISPGTAGHSSGVARLVTAAAQRCRIDAVGTTTLRRAALVHDLGRVAVHPRVWNKPDPLNADEREQVRLHPYHTERVLSRSAFLSALCPVAGAHHEHLDGSGYHRGSRGTELTSLARLLAAADAYQAMTEPRAHRPAMSPSDAAQTLAREARAGRLDADAVTAVVEAAGQPTPRLERPAGLTEREAAVIHLLARDLQTKQVARTLGISVKTADRHVQNAYRKIGVSTRAAATLYAMEHGLLAWGELPMARPAGRS